MSTTTPAGLRLRWPKMPLPHEKDSDPARSLAKELRTAAAECGLGADEVVQLLWADPEVRQHLSHAELAAETRRIFGESGKGRPQALALIAKRLGDAVGRTFDHKRVVGPGQRALSRLSTVVGGMIFLVVSYLVIGGLALGESHLLGDQGGVVSLVAFFASLLVLGLFEALHISVTQLKTSDLTGVALTHPLALRLHREFRDNFGIQRFLAGRQIAVIFTVFLISAITAFPDMETWPLTETSLPGVVRPLLAIGVPGAFFTLWLAQLAPQFIATERPLTLMSARVVGVAFRIALVLEAIGLGKPGFWISDALPDAEEKPPSSPGKRWAESASEVEGLGVVGIKRFWRVGPERSGLEAETITAFFGDGRQSWIDRSIMLPGAAEHLELDMTLRGQNAEFGLFQTGLSEERLQSGDRRLHKSAIPAVGAFGPGDSLSTRLSASFAGPISRDVVHTDRPVRYLLLRVEPASEPAHMPPAHLWTYRVGDGVTDLTPEGEPLLILPSMEDRGLPVIEHVVVFPQANTLYVFEWEIGF